MSKCIIYEKMSSNEIVLFSEQQDPLALLTEDWSLKELHTHTL